MKRHTQEGTKKALAILAIIIFAGIVGHIVSTTSFNQKVHTVQGADDRKASYLSFAPREDSTSSWLKRDFLLDGKKVDLKANTIDGTFYNHASHDIVSWKMKLTIQGDCFINNAWCGTVEIHQFAGTDKEIVQKLDLRNYELEDVKLKHLYDGDLLIPLQKGDYLIYYPSEKDDEIPISADSELTIGAIFYYLDSLDLSNYEIQYTYHKSFTEGIGFNILVVLIILWLGMFIAMIVADITYRRTVKAMELRMSGISYMSDIYDIIYIIDLETDDLTPMEADEISERNRPAHMGARDQLLNLFAHDAAPAYMEMMQEFADIQTLNQRLEKQSIACDYFSKNNGWTRIRFFAMDREEGQPLKHVLFTIQNIQDEKEFEEEKQRRILETSKDRMSKGVFFDILSDMVRTSTQTVLEDTTRITKERPGKQVAAHTAHIAQTEDQLLRLTDRLTDASAIYSHTMKLELAEYSFKQLATHLLQEAAEAASEKGLTLETDISPQIPDRLCGDSGKIRKITQFLLDNSIRHTEKGNITFSIFVKTTESNARLLISIKDTGSGIPEKILKRLTTQWTETEHNWYFTKEEPGLGLTMIHEMLGLMDASLGIISEYGTGSEFYFEIDQKIVDPAPIGPMNAPETLQ